MKLIAQADFLILLLTHPILYSRKTSVTTNINIAWRGNTNNLTPKLPIIEYVTFKCCTLHTLQICGENYHA